ncbi:MAG: hypothetical protein IPH16_18450 [Haliscomenobacter sp.]|nr:hypothetical protein [Haliscomenobacter sp.]
MENAFRPALTQALVRGLKGSNSYNLTGDPGSGRSRLLEDIKAGLDDCKAAIVNMREFKGHYEGFVWELARQLGIPGCKHLGDVANFMLQNSGKQFVLLLDNFEAILGVVDKDPRYDTHFLGELNNLKNLDNANLAVNTQKPYLDYTLSTEKDWHTLSQLNLTRKQIPPYTLEEIQRDPSASSGLEPGAIAFITQDLSRPYDVFMEVLSRIKREGAPEDFPKAAKGWKREMEQRPSYSLERGLVKFNHWVEKWKRLGKPVWFLIGLLTGITGTAICKFVWYKIHDLWNYLIP